MRGFLWWQLPVIREPVVVKSAIRLVCVWVRGCVCRGPVSPDQEPYRSRADTVRQIRYTAGVSTRANTSDDKIDKIPARAQSRRLTRVPLPRSPRLPTSPTTPGVMCRCITVACTRLPSAVVEGYPGPRCIFPFFPFFQNRRPKGW